MQKFKPYYLLAASEAHGVYEVEELPPPGAVAHVGGLVGLLPHIADGETEFAIVDATELEQILGGYDVTLLQEEKAP